MSVTNLINDEKMTILQGVNGICLCQESWMTDKKEKAEIQTMDYLLSNSDDEQSDL